ncbi:hypothetical protein E4U11_001290, partial [Claviceps purpurea]
HSSRVDLAYVLRLQFSSCFLATAPGGIIDRFLKRPAYIIFLSPSLPSLRVVWTTVNRHSFLQRLSGPFVVSPSSV